MLYQESSKIIEAVQAKRGSVKNLVLGSQFKNKKPLYALVCQTLKYTKILDEILGATKLRKQEKALKSQSLAQVLVYDFLIGKGLQSAGHYKEIILKHKAALKAELARLKIKAKVTKNDDLLSSDVKNQVTLPRYVRVNLLKTTVSDVMQHFKTEGYTQVYLDKRLVSYDRFIEAIGSLQAKQFAQDLHLSDLLVFPATTDLHAHVLYKSGDIILQDKASCMPAHVLSAPPGSHVIDCCAAPGNKTTHIASLMGNKGKIFAFDLDGKRLSTMSMMSLRAGVLCADMCQKDFLTVQPTDPKYSKVQYILVDPSCSGSGIVNRMNTVTDDENSASTKRLDNLAKFQVSILKHAMSFPNVKRVVYSTCSIHEKENESVVKEALEYFSGLFVLTEALPVWEHRGKGQLQESRLCVRTNPEADLTNGFFVACLEKNQEGGKNVGQDCPQDALTVVEDIEMNGQHKTEEEVNILTDHKDTHKVAPQKDKRKRKHVEIKQTNEKPQKALQATSEDGKSVTSKKKKRKKEKLEQVKSDISKGDALVPAATGQQHEIQAGSGPGYVAKKKQKHKWKKTRKSIV